MKAIILAGGKGTRLPESGKTIPKALVMVGAKPIIQHQIDHLESHGISDIRLALGFRAEQIIDYLEGKYKYVVEDEPLGTGGAVLFASRDLKEPFMVLNGDILSDVDVSAFVRSYSSGKNMLVVCRHEQNTDFGYLELDDEKRIVAFREKPEIPTDGHVSVGYYILHPEVFNGNEKKIFSIEYDVFPKLAEKRVLHGFEHTGYWHDLGTEERLEYVKFLFLSSQVCSSP